MIAAAPAAGEPLFVLWLAASGILPLCYLLARPLRPPAAPPFAPTDVAGAVLAALALFLVYQIVLGLSAGQGSAVGILGGLVALAAAAGIGARPLRVVLRPSRGRLSRAGVGLLIAWAALPLVFGALELVQRFGAEGTQEVIDVMQRRKRGWLGLVFIAGVVAPVVEEVGFRGLLYPALRQWRGPGVATAVTALAFALVHWPATTWAPLAILACFLAYSVEATGSILPAIAGHVAFNALTLLQLL